MAARSVAANVQSERGNTQVFSANNAADLVNAACAVEQATRATMMATPHDAKRTSARQAL